MSSDIGKGISRLDFTKLILKPTRENKLNFVDNRINGGFSLTVISAFDDIHERKLHPTYSCEHLAQSKEIRQSIKSYKRLNYIFVSSSKQRARNLKAKHGRCMECESKDQYVISCLECIYFGCIKSGHFLNHVEERRHTLGVELSSGALYCFKCQEILFDREIEAIAALYRKKVEDECRDSVSSAKLPVTYELNQYKFSSESLITYHVLPTSTIGLRGLVNLGHTCFMNCIIQALIHTPLLRDFFLTERVVCIEKHDVKKQKPCIITQLYDLYQEFYSGLRTPLSLHRLLYKFWGNALHLAGYEQQDAHEFFIAMLDALHHHYTSNQAGGCNCVIDMIFLGRLQSAVTCMVCGHQSITVDPFWDISLDLIINSLDSNATISLHECLNRYTRVEYLGSSGMIHCNNCLDYQESTKQLKFKSLPLVLCLHLKRFEHSTNYKKIGNCVKYPERLQLASYTSQNEGMISSSRSRLLQKILDEEFQYTLFAVVNHVGSFEGGHYYAYIKQTRNEWYKCDDHLITSVSRDEVLRSPGYLLFYHKTSLSD